MSFIPPRRSPRSRPGSRSTTPNQDIKSPTKKRRAKSQKPMSKKVSKTFQALAKMAEDSDSNNTSVQSACDKQFGGVKNIKLSDYSLDEEERVMSKITGTSKSIYSGAGIKLDAFDCFHRVLNECVDDYTFTIADAALILKQLTPDIIKKIVPLMTQQQSNLYKRQSAVKKQEDKTEYYEGAIDLEVSEINKEQQKSSASISNKPKTSIKRPDASRPTRLLSPGSNACSPVSAAVHALISISAPIIEGTITHTDVMSQRSEKTNKGIIASSNPGIIDEEKTNESLKIKSVFVPLSKPSVTSKEFTESVFVPVPKAATISSCYNKDSAQIPSCTNQSETTEVLAISKRDCFSDSPGTASFISSSSLAASSLLSYGEIMSIVDSKTAVVSQASGVTQALKSSIPHSKVKLDNKSYIVDSINHGSHSNLAQDDPLPHFNLLLSTSGLPLDIPCGLPSPFSHQLPASPMPAVTAVHVPPTQELSTITAPSRSISQVIMPQCTASAAGQAFINSQVASLPLIPPSCIEQQTYIEHVSVTQDEFQAVMNNPRLQNQFRTILPKPYVENTAANLTVVSVLPTSATVTANTVSQLSPVIKLDDKRILQYSVPSVPPSQIFTKLNQVTNNNQFGTVPIQPPPLRPIFPNQGCFFPATTMENLFFERHLLINQSIENVTENSGKPKVSLNSDILILPRDSKVPMNLIPKPENVGGNLEVASALLSMGTESAQTLDNGKTVPGTAAESLEQIVRNSIRHEDNQVDVSFNEDGTFKIDYVDIDPEKHSIRKDNFTCGKCKRVFTSVMYLARHIKRVCPDMSQRKWKCDRCSKAFRHPFGLQQHIYTHTGERPHKCEHCSKAFYSANDLRRHMRTHSGERPYQCTHCDKTFSTTISLRTHTYIHTGERPHRCPHCPKTFATSSKLSRHVVTHSDKRPYPCDQCAKTFNRSGDLRRHYSQHHGKSHELLECDQCNKVFATQKCLLNHKATHKRDADHIPPQHELTNEQDVLNRNYAVPRF